MAEKKKGNPAAQKKVGAKQSKAKIDDFEYIEPEEEDFEYEDLRDNGDFPPLPEDLYSIVSIIEEYAMSEAENALWRAYAAVEDSADIETAKKRIRALIRKLS